MRSWGEGQDAGGDEDIKNSFASLKLAMGPALFIFVCDKKEGYRGDYFILSEGEGRENTVKGTF